MRTKHLLLLILGFTSLQAYSQVSKSINVAVPGTLSTLLTEGERTSVTDLTLTGTIDSIDFIFLRDQMTVLASLDLSGAATVKNAIYHNALGPKYTLTSLLLPPTTTRLGKESLMSCKLSSLILPPALKIIQNAALRYCTIKEINIPSQVEIIEDVFASCDSLNAITVDEANPHFSSLDGVLFNKDATQILVYPPKKKGPYQIPNTVIEMVDWVFSGCHYLERLYIPGSVRTIGQCFYANMLLTGFDVDPENMYYRDIDGVLFTADTSTLIQYPIKRPTDSYEIPKGTELLQYGSFRDCMLSHISFPHTLLTIEGSAFRYCRNLLSVELPASVRFIGMYAFGYCDNLNFIRIPSSLKSVEYEILNGAIGLDTIMVNSMTPFPLSDMYHYFTNVDTNNCLLLVPSGSVEVYSSALHWRSFQHMTEYETAFEISQTVFNPVESGEELSFQITSNTEWRIKPTVPWLHFSDTLGTDSKTVTVMVDANTSGDRQANVSVIPLDKEQITLSFSQAGSATTVSEINNEKEKLYYDIMQKCLIIRDLSGSYLSVFSMDGKLALSRKIVDNYETLNAENLPEGVYIVRAGSCILKLTAK